MDINQPTPLVIKEHDFQEAKNALKKYAEQAEEKIELVGVPTKGGLFHLGNHKVTGSELNDIISSTQNYLINIYKFNQDIIKEFEQVYKAFESLDKGYIAGIVTSIKAAAEVSKQEQKDRRDIKELVEQHEKSVAVLKKFKQDIDKLKHLMDIDKAWELLEKQTKLSKEFADYRTSLSKLKHLKDVDVTYSDFERLKKEFAKSVEEQSQYVAELKSVHEYCEMLSKIQHIKDIDKLWNSNDDLTKSAQNFKETLRNQYETISNLHGTLQCMQETQQQFIETVNKLIADSQKDINSQIQSFMEKQTMSLNDISLEQKEGLASIEKTQNERLCIIAEEQTATLSEIKKAQTEKMELLSADQTKALEQMSLEQSVKQTEMSEAFDIEKASLNEMVSNLAKRVKLSYYVAGGAVALTIVQLLLNILGVI